MPSVSPRNDTLCTYPTHFRSLFMGGDYRCLSSIVDSRVTLDGGNAIAGIGVGTLVGLTGVGGGALMTPSMVMLFGIAPHTAVGTDLWFAAITKIFGGWVHGKRGTVDWQVLRRLFSGSIPACLLTLLWLHFSGSADRKSTRLNSSH